MTWPESARKLDHTDGSNAGWRGNSGLTVFQTDARLKRTATRWIEEAVNGRWEAVKEAVAGR